MLDWNSIYCMDCLAGIPQIADNSVDIVIADPPYNIGKDFGNNKDNLSLDKYQQWSKQWINECFRVMKPTATMYIYGFSEILAHISTLIDINKQHWIIWHYTNKNVPSLNFWQRSHEAIIACWKGKPIFNRDEVREPYTENFLKNSAGKIRNGTKSRFGKKGLETIYNAHPNGALPRDVFNISTLAGGASLKERIMYCKTCGCIIEPSMRKKHLNHDIIIHPTQKPSSVTKKIVTASKPEGKFNVLIPFSGSGSECGVVKNMGGNFIGFDISPDFVKLSSEYLKTIALNPQKSFL